MTLYDFDCGFVLPVPPELEAQFVEIAKRVVSLRAALDAYDVIADCRWACECPKGHRLGVLEYDVRPAQPVAVAWQDRMLEGVGMGETVKVGHGGKESTGA